jgi:hypothetical protein
MSPTTSRCGRRTALAVTGMAAAPLMLVATAIPAQASAQHVVTEKAGYVRAGVSVSRRSSAGQRKQRSDLVRSVVLRLEWSDGLQN